MKKISIIIPTYNSAKTITRCLNSVMKQTIEPREIIVIDNGSTDQTYQMVSSLFPNINYFTEKKEV